MRRPVFALLVLALVTSSLAGCAGVFSGAGVTQVVIFAEGQSGSITMFPGERIEVVARGYDSQGRSVATSDSDYTWGSTDPDVVYVIEGSGETTIVATNRARSGETAIITATLDSPNVTGLLYVRIR